MTFKTPKEVGYSILRYTQNQFKGRDLSKNPLTQDERDAILIDVDTKHGDANTWNTIINGLTQVEKDNLNNRVKGWLNLVYTI